MNNNTNYEREFGWDDEIVNESEFTLLPEGDYNFEVTKFERGRHAGSAKLPPCNKAELTVKITSDDGKQSTTLQHNLFLHTKCEGLLSEFFISIGQKKHGEPLRMNWPAVIGAKGRCTVYIDKYTKKDGSAGESNKIKRFLEPAEQSAGTVAPSRQFVPGSFGK